MTKNTLRNGPNAAGYYGEFGSRYAPEILMPNLIELEKAFNDAINDQSFIDEFEYYLKEWVGRPNPLYFAQQLTKQIGGAKIYFKSDHLNHLGAHKLNNSLFQILLAKRMSKKKIYAETGAGAHLIATAAACAKFNLPCIGYIGIDDSRKQSTNVLKAKLFGAKVFLADVDKSTGQMQPNDILNCCKKFKLKKIKALIVMYNGGYPQNADSFKQLKKKLGCIIIEDACHALGAEYINKKKGIQLEVANIAIYQLSPFIRLKQLQQAKVE